MRRLVLWAAFLPALASGQGIITTVAGTDKVLPFEGISAANFDIAPYGHLVVDSSRNVYFTDNTVSKVLRLASDGKLFTFAGNGLRTFSGDSGPAANASLFNPYGLAMDSQGNILIADSNNNRIRRVSRDGTITTVVGNGFAGYNGDNLPAASASLNGPVGVAFDSSGNILIADTVNQRIRRIVLGYIQTIAGNGQRAPGPDGVSATSTALGDPNGLAVDMYSTVYFSDTASSRVRRVSGGVINKFADISFPRGMLFDPSGNLIVASSQGNAVFSINPAGSVATLAGGRRGFSGDNGPATAAALNRPVGVALDPSGSLYIGDGNNGRIRKVTNGIITSIAGSRTSAIAGDQGRATNALLYFPNHAVPDNRGNLYIADTGQYRVRKVAPDGTITTVAGTGIAGYSGDQGPATSAMLYDPYDVAVDSVGNLYICDTSNNVIRKVDLNGTITTVAGTGVAGYSPDGVATSVRLNAPQAIAIDSGDGLYIADTGNQLVRRLYNGMILTIAGVPQRTGFSPDGTRATQAYLNRPEGVAVDAFNNVYISDTFNHLVRIASAATGTVSTLAGTGVAGYNGDNQPATSTSLNFPVGVAVDSAGAVYIADTNNYRIRKVVKGTITTLAGTGDNAYYGDGRLSTSAAVSAFGVALDQAGNVFIADNNNNRVRVILANAPVYQAQPTSLTFSATAGGTAPAAQAIGLTSTVTGMAYIASASQSWIQITPSSGALPATLQVSIDPTTLGAGTANGQVYINVPGTNPGVVAISVTVNLTARQPAQLGLDTAQMNFAFVQGDSPSTANLGVTNTGSGTLAFTVISVTGSANASWVALTPSQGTVTPNTPVKIAVTATPGRLDAGTYNATITLGSQTTGDTKQLVVVMTVSAPAAKPVLSQRGLTFRAVAQGGAPLGQPIGIYNVGAGSMNWSAQPVTFSGGSWLALSQTSGTVTRPYQDVSSLNVSVQPSGLAPGDYFGQVQVTVPGTSLPTVVASVVLQVLPAGSTLPPEVRPSSLVFVGAPGSSPGSQDVFLANRGASPLSYSSSQETDSGQRWLEYTPPNGIVTPNQPGKITIQPDFTSLAAGANHGSVNLLFSGGSIQKVDVLSLVTSTSGSSGSSARIGRSAAREAACDSLQITMSNNQALIPVRIGDALAFEVSVRATCGGNLVTGPSASNWVEVALSNKQRFRLGYSPAGVWTGTWTAQPPEGNLSGTVTAFAVAQGSAQQGQIAFTVQVQGKSSQPTLTTVLNSASSALGPISPGGLFTVKGDNLADGDGVIASTRPWPTKLNGATVTLAGKALPLLYAAQGQLNFQVPYDVAFNSQAQLVVNHGNATMTPEPVPVAPTQPAIFAMNQQGFGQGAITNAVTNVLSDANGPVKAGDIVSIYCTGLGAVNPPVAAGAVSPRSPLAETVVKPTVLIGNTPAQVQFSGLSPDLVALYQVNAFVPAGISPGDSVPVVLQIGNQSSNVVTIAVR